MAAPFDRRGPRRLHPSSLLFNIGRYGRTLLLPGLLVFFFAAGDPEDAWLMWAFVPALAYSVLRYLTLRYEMGETELIVREGLIFKSTRHVPYTRVQNVDTTQNPFHRLLRVAVVRIETAAGKEPEAVLQVVAEDDIEDLRRGIFAGRARAQSSAAPGGPVASAPGIDVAPDAELAPDTELAIGAGDAGKDTAGVSASTAPPFFRMGAGDILLFGLLSQRGIAYLGGAFFLAWEFSIFDKFEERLGVDLEEWVRGFVESQEGPAPMIWVAVAVVGVVLLQLLTTLWAFLTLHGFQLTRSGDDVRSVCGLWTRQTATLPRQRVQRLAVREGWFLRRLGRGCVRVTTAGAETEGTQLTRKWFVPVAARSELAAVLREVQPAVDFDVEHWAPVHPRAARRMARKLSFFGTLALGIAALNFGPWTLLAAPVWWLLAGLLARNRARRLGWHVAGEAILLRDGWLAIERTAVRFSKIQSVSLARTPFDRRHGMASVRVATAGGSEHTGSLTVPYLSLADAARLARRLSGEAAALEFRW